MAERMMTVTFRRHQRTCSWSASLPRRRPVVGPTMAAGADLPHDLSTFVIEDALGIAFGFWGCVAAGATFKTLQRRRTPQGKAVIAQHRDELAAAEVVVNERYFAWRAGQPGELDAVLDDMLRRWRAVPVDGGELVLPWSMAR